MYFVVFKKHVTVLKYLCDYFYGKYGKSEGNYFLPGGRLPAVMRFQNLYKKPPELVDFSLVHGVSMH